MLTINELRKQRVSGNGELATHKLVKDWQKIAAKIKELETSRIQTFYLGAIPHLTAFANVLGKALRAQAIIAACNTILTAAGLWFFNVPNIALLSTIVFFCGFIPILGTFLSSIPILLFGIQVGGSALVLKLIALIAVIHAFEAYVLNPKITGNVLLIHPILVLILLLIGERFFGIWGSHAAKCPKNVIGGGRKMCWHKRFPLS